MNTTGYLDTHPQTRPRVLAHRGLTYEGSLEVFDENTLEAFARAIEVGADFIESDIHVTKDLVPVLYHDPDLRRATGKRTLVSSLGLSELKQIRLPLGGRIPTLAEALERFPKAKFNLDLKTQFAEATGINTILKHGAENRVLITSFSDKSRLRALALSPTPLASSAGSSRVAMSYMAARIGAETLVADLLSDVAALQIPTKRFGIDLTHPAFLEKVLPLGVEIHYWTINEPDHMQELFNLGAHGIVTDRADVAIQTFS